MAATSLGLVGIVSKGDYSASATYIKGNFVYHNQSTWLCIAETITGSEPSESNSNWQLLAKGVQLVVFTGATASTDGTMGAVPQPLAGDEGKFLKGSGGWANVPNPQVFTGATASADGTSGLLPVPHAGDEGKFIRGDGSWASAAADDNFVGTLAQWNTLSLAEQKAYKTADITDDFNGSPVDSALSNTSTNPVQNRVVKAAIDDVKTGIKEQITFTLNDATGFYYSYIARRDNILIISGDLRGNLTANTDIKCLTLTNDDVVIETPYVDTAARFPTNNGWAWITANKEVYIRPNQTANNIQILLVIPLV